MEEVLGVLPEPAIVDAPSSAITEAVRPGKVEKDAHLWARDGLDWYVEPESATAQLLSVEKFDGAIWDPTCGGGNIVKTCLSHGYEAFGSDITRRVPWETPWFRGERDFLAERYDYPNIVFNPPFYRAKGLEACIRRALEVANGKVCAFADIKFLAGGARGSGLYAEHPPSRVWIITPRPSCPPGAYLAAGNEAGGGTADWAWLVWDKDRDGTTQLGWLKRGQATASPSGENVMVPGMNTKGQNQ